MVKAAEILNKIVDRQDFRDQKEVDHLLKICREDPDFKQPFILLKNYQPDFFNSEFWKRGEDFEQVSKELFDCYYGNTSLVESTQKQKSQLTPNEIQDSYITQRKAIELYLMKPKETFI